ncbi:MAG: amidohydrolase family protein [Pseudomonadota bacterium]
MTVSYFMSPEWMIDGTGSPCRKNAAIGIQGETIVSIVDSTEIREKSQDDSFPRVVDLRGFTVLPCLVDSHVHLVMSGSNDPEVRERQLVSGYSEAGDRIQHHLQEHFRYGVLAVRDGGDRHGYTLRYRDNLNGPSRSSYVSAIFAGKAWHREGRYGGLIGRVPIKSKGIAESVALEGVKSDVIKVVNSGLNSLREFGKQTLPQFGFQEFKDLLNMARRLEKKVMVHANGIEPVSIPVDAGCDSIEHGFFMGRENLEKMAEKGIFWVPTAVTMEAYSRLMKDDPKISDNARRNLDHQLEQIRIARECGVRTAMGTDAGSPGVDHGKAVIEEMKLFMDAGYSLEEAVMCATSAGADLSGFTAIGQLKPGMNAGFLVVPGPPSKLPDSLESIQMIWCNGKMVYEKYAVTPDPSGDQDHRMDK